MADDASSSIQSAQLNALKDLPISVRFAGLVIILVIGFLGTIVAVVDLPGWLLALLILSMIVLLFAIAFSAHGLLRGPLGSAQAPAPTSDHGEDSPPAATTASRLRDLELISEGLASLTYSAFDPDLKRRVVKKRLTDLSRSEEFKAGVREAKKVSDRANFVTIYWADLDDPEGPYFVRQYLDQSLQDMMGQQPSRLPIDYVRRVVFKIGSAIRQAHEAGVKLGNVRASNIMLDANEEPHVSPRALETFVSPAQLREAVRERKLTPEDLTYLAPELLCRDGGGSPIIELSDQYALGILAYHLLTGELPPTLAPADDDDDRDSEDPRASQVDRACELVLEQGMAAYVALPPLNEVHAQVPTLVGQILARMTALRPEDRYERLDLALAALRSADQSILLAARDSYTRCLAASDRSPTFFECFYAQFTANETVGARFAMFETPAQWTAQHGKLQASLDACFDFAKLLITEHQVAEPNAMTWLVARHGPKGLAISDVEYDAFVDALVATVCGEDGRAPYDPECASEGRRAEIARAWRELMAPIVRHFKDAR